MKLNNAGYQMICDFEGFMSKPYLCSAKLATIGYGNTFYPDGKKVTLLDKEITKQEGFEMFKEIADRFAKSVSKLVKQPLNQNQFNSLVSFAYNCGVANFMNSTLLKRVNVNANDPDIRVQFMRWNKANGKVLNGLINRRKNEANTYFS